MKNYTKHLYIAVFLFGLGIQAQEKVLTKEEAVQLALENNYGIKVSNNNLKIAENNKNILNTGFLPTLSGNGGATKRVQNSEIVRPSNSDRSIDTILKNSNAESSNYTAAVNLNYTLFNGLGRHYNYKQLKEQYNLSELQAKETIENTLFQLFTVYYNVAKLTEDVTLLKQNLNISKDRLQRVNYQFDYGQNTKLAVLNAEVDVNNDSINLLNTKQLLANAKRDLYVVLGQKEAPYFSVDTTVLFSITPSKEDLFEQVKTNNVVLQQVEKNIIISDFQVKANRSGYLPTIGLTGTYGWNENNVNPVINFSQQTTWGLTGSINLSWNVFDGGRTRTQVQNAKIAFENQQLLKEQTELEITTDFNNSWENYQNKLFVLQTQEKNMQTNTNNFNRTEEQFKLGQVTSIEFRQAQLNLINAINAKNAAKYDAKLAELQLLQLSGQLLDAQF